MACPAVWEMCLAVVLTCLLSGLIILGDPAPQTPAPCGLHRVTNNSRTHDCGNPSLTCVRNTDTLNMTLTADVTAHTVTPSYVVILYECDSYDLCCDNCMLSELEKHVLTSINPTVRFANILPGYYRVWVRPAGSVTLCVQTGVLDYTHTASSPPTRTTKHRRTTDITNNITTSLPSPSPHTQRSFGQSVGTQSAAGSLPQTSSTVGVGPDRREADDLENWKKIVVAVVAVLTGIVVLLVGVGVCYCWRQRGRSLKFVHDLPCLDKLVTPGSSGSTIHNTDQSRPGPSDHVSDPSSHVLDMPSRLTCPALSLCLLTHSRRPLHTHLTDCLALYLQAFCACDLTYLRWQLDDIRVQGPEAWTVEQLDKADCVVFVHSSETEDCYDVWKSGQAWTSEHGVSVRVLGAAFDHVFQHAASLSNWVHVTFSSHLTVEGRSRFFTQCITAVERSLDRSPCGVDQGIVVDGDDNSSGMMSHSPACQRLYLLMNDFSQLLADIHHLPNIPSVLKERNLPTDSEHLDTPEGRQLYQAVVSLNMEAKEGDNFLTAIRGKNCVDWEAQLVVDSGFGDHLSFIAPEDVSMVDTDCTSVGERLRALNTHYEGRMAGEESMSRSECYSLGGRCV